MAGKKNELAQNLEKLSSITKWFEDQEEIDLELGLEKIKEAGKLIKGAKEKLKKIENEFKEIQKEL